MTTATDTQTDPPQLAAILASAQAALVSRVEPFGGKPLSLELLKAMRREVRGYFNRTTQYASTATVADLVDEHVDVDHTGARALDRRLGLS